MLSAQQRNKYMENSVQTATPGQLLIMLYDGAIRFCRAGIEGIKNKDYEAANYNLCRTQSIINELLVTLDRSVPISENLESLYVYMLQQLIQANVKKSIEPAQEVLGYLSELKETWVIAARPAASTVESGRHG